MATTSVLNDPVRVGDVVICEAVVRDNRTAGKPRVTPAAVSVEIYDPNNPTEPAQTLTASTADVIIRLGEPLTENSANALLLEGEANDGAGSFIVEVRATEAGTWKIYGADTAVSGAHTWQFRALSKTS
ncbi:MAG: hypothetical protein AAGA37_19700 [Actinomycetota bacterium]